MIWVIRNGQEIVSNNNFEFHYGFFKILNGLPNMCCRRIKNKIQKPEKSFPFHPAV